MKKLVTALALGLVTALVVAGVTGAAGTSKLHATLNAGQEVPHPAGKLTGATGTFTATLKSDGSITWTLTYKGLSGPATAAHIHLAKVGVAGPVALPLCGPCHSGQTGSGKLTAAQAKAVESHGAYVNIHTAKNPNGEIRGLITSSPGSGY